MQYESPITCGKKVMAKTTCLIFLKYLPNTTLHNAGCGLVNGPGIDKRFWKRLVTMVTNRSVSNLEVYSAVNIVL